MALAVAERDTRTFAETRFAQGVAARILVVSANAEFRRQVRENLPAGCWPIEEAQGGADALDKLEAQACQTLLLDRWLPDLDVRDVVEMISTRHPQVNVLLMDSQSGETLMSKKPPRRVTMLSPFEVPQRTKQLMVGEYGEDADRRAPRLPPRPELVEPLPGMVGTGPKMTRVYRLARLVSQRDTTVLVTGETGTGKELVARAIHQMSARSKRPFVVVNCAAIPEPLLEAELFGYARGAFTGAFQSRVGRIHAAHGGTLFLDEVGELSTMQAKLLRFLQEGEVQRLGSPDVFRVDARVIAATNANLAQRAIEGQFRRDLYYRLAVFPIELPSLHEHPQDIAPIAERFLEGLCRQAYLPPKTISREAGALLEQYSWPGNVRELEHVIERAFIVSEGEPELLPEHFWSLPGEN